MVEEGPWRTETGCGLNQAENPVKLRRMNIGLVCIFPGPEDVWLV